MLANMFIIVGFLLALLGIGLWSVPAACLVAGIILFVAGGLDQARKTP